MTSNLLDEYRKKVDALADYDFSLYNIYTIQLEMSKNLTKWIEDCIIGLFDECLISILILMSLVKISIITMGGRPTNAGLLIRKSSFRFMMPGVSWGDMTQLPIRY